MILFYGYRDDDPLALAVDAARDADLDFLFVDQRNDAFHDAVAEFTDDGLRLRIVRDGDALPLDEVDAVYARPLSPPRGDARSTARAATVSELILDWLDCADCLVVNRPSAMHSNTSKPFQAQFIANAGLRIPTSLISNDEERIRDFWTTNSAVIYKSTSGVRSIVQRLDPTAAARLAHVRDLPVQFQELIEGVDVRVHVVGQQVFATEIESPAVDYRYAGRDGLEAQLAECELPAEVAARCVQVTEALGLTFAGIDLLRTGDGHYVCLEVNPMPGYSYFERATGQPISRAVVEQLTNGGR